MIFENQIVTKLMANFLKPIISFLYFAFNHNRLSGLLESMDEIN